MKFTAAIFAALALASGVIAAERQNTMRNLARALIAEYEDFLVERELESTLELEARVNGCVARNKKGYLGMECDLIRCQASCSPLPGGRCGWPAGQPANCAQCACQKE